MRRSGFSLVEIITVVTVLVAIVLWGAQISSNVTTAVRVKGSIEQLMWEMRAAQQYAVARGGSPPTPGDTGVWFFNNRVNATRTGGDGAAGTGCSYVVWGGDVRNHGRFAKPSTASISGSTPYLPYVVNFPAGTVLANKAGKIFIGGESITFTRNGDVSAGSLGGVLASAGWPVQIVVQDPVPPAAPEIGPFTLTIWGEDTGSIPGYERPKSIMLQGPP